MASTRSASFDISHFDRAIKSSVSTLSDKCIKEITSLHRKVIPGFFKGRDTFACLSTGYTRETTPSIAGQTSFHKLLSPQKEKSRIAIKPTVS